MPQAVQKAASRRPPGNPSILRAGKEEYERHGAEKHHEVVPLEVTRDAVCLRDEAATIVEIPHDEIDARFFSAESDIKN